MKTVFFDIDGTLLDSLASIETALNTTRQVLGLPRLSSDTIKAAVGYGAPELIRRTTPPERCSELAEIYPAQLFKESPPPFPFIPEILEQLRDMGFELIAASNKPCPVARECLRKARLDHFFTEVRGVSEACRPKPHPDLLVLESGAAAVLVGDGDADVDAAAAAGIPVIAVTWGFRDAAQLTAAGAKTICEDPAQLVRLIDAHFE